MLAKAIDYYMLKRCPAFCRFLDDGRFCLSNNATSGPFATGETRRMPPLTQQKGRVVEIGESCPKPFPPT
jgi:hypothetical protein